VTEAPALPPRRRTIIGIDPGKTGAIAVLTYGAGADDELEVIDMPTIDVGVSGKLRKAIHIRSLLEFFDILQYQSPDLVVLEKVGAMPGQSGMFDFGYGVGVLKTILTLHCLHV
jgi:hypothetical protein